MMFHRHGDRWLDLGLQRLGNGRPISRVDGGDEFDWQGPSRVVGAQYHRPQIASILTLSYTGQGWGTCFALSAA
jgi:hypothetical protein